MAQGYCAQLRDEDGRNGCMAGIYLAKEDLSMATGYCAQLKDEDGRNGCMADVNVVGYFVAENKKESSYDNSEILKIEEETKQLEKELDADKAEALEMIRELEACEECLKDPEMKELYLQLKGDL